MCLGLQAIHLDEGNDDPEGESKSSAKAKAKGKAKGKAKAKEDAAAAQTDADADDDDGSAGVDAGNIDLAQMLDEARKAVKGKGDALNVD